MDKLQWFKFSYADWRMGKIQKCSEITQARFLNLCCLYWSKEANLSYQDAEIEIDKEHLDALLSKKIIERDEEHIFIKFLDEQLEAITETSKGKSKAAKIRWDKYKKDKSSEVQTDADAMHVHTDAMQNDAEKRRGEKRRGEKTKQEVPTLEEFISHAVERKKNVCTEEVRLKYFAWLDNNWSITRNNKTEPIKNWKSSLTNTVKYLGEAYKQPSKPIEETFEQRIIRLNLEAKANG